MKKLLSVFILLIFIINSCIVYADDVPCIELDYAKNDDAVSVYISLNGISDISGGSFNIGYDNEVLKFLNYTIDGSTSNMFVNEKYKENMIRVSWAGSSGTTPNEPILSISFQMINNGVEKTSINIDSPKLADGNGNKLSVNGSLVDIVLSETTPSKRHRSSDGIKTALTTETTTATKTETTAEATKTFSDVLPTDWYYSYINEAYEKGYMTGISDAEFAPNNSLTRAMFVTVLYRIEGKLTFMNDLIFDDVEKGSYYEKAVVWANGKGIVSGTSENKFAPNDNITREQIAAILYRYAKYKGIDTESITADTNTLSFNDIFEVSDWASSGMHFCIAADIISGDGENVKPKENATRAEMATMISRFTRVIMQ